MDSVFCVVKFEGGVADDTEVFDWLYEQLGHDTFTSLFQVILTDRGSEFTNPLAIEFNKDNERRTHIFYCDPQRSDQKGAAKLPTR